MNHRQRVESARVGARVRLADTAQHPDYAGLTGVVARAVKSLGLYMVRLDDGRTYNVLPQNVRFEGE